MSPFGANEVAVELLEELIAAVFECALGLLCYSVQLLVTPTRHSRSPDIDRRCRHTLYPKKVGLQPVTTPVTPST